MNFEVLWLFVKFGGMVSIGSTSEQSEKVFSMKIVFSTHLCKFSPSKVFHYVLVGDLSLLENVRERKNKLRKINDVLFLFTNISRYTDPVTKVKYFAKVAFKLRIEPESYKVSTQTVQAAGSQIDDHFSNSELEWSTKCRKAIILYGLMVKLESSE